ncbi:glycosyltransferase family 4 protein [Synechococcus lacustris C3-12m-Tous]|uniref:glycosyltransferase family 4 protein n=1 Tax=Synechococcus lacustris TaxID=2116544 RepID=UPI0020CF24F8|nr:glycosyltransferase family 4 protein [Synechococcus lacustris]MCP9925562.1 glycosyltransferase family 4 protein [Synechococcus lacustris C3-12m-Tous]
MPELFPAALMLPGDAFDLDRHQVMGRRVAGRSFVRGLVKNLRPFEHLNILVSKPEEIISLKSLLQPVCPSDAKLRFNIGFNPASLEDVGALHVPDPGLARWGLLREGRATNSFSITGVIHTLCSQSVISSLENLAVAPLEPWDALICTSNAGREVVAQAMASQHEALSRRYCVSLPPPPGPQLPVIPLAIEDSLPPIDHRNNLRRNARQSLGIPKESFVVLFLGRLSFHSKAHPLVLYRVLSQLNAESGDIILLECGHLFNSYIASAYDELQSFFPDLSVRRLGGLEPATEADKQLALAASDVFVSLADNLQETFGLSLLEAMAAQLPVVVSDWNGYRDLVQHGVTGFLIPTRALLGSELHLDYFDQQYRLGLLDYDTYVGIRSLEVIVEEIPLLKALRFLYLNPDRRRTIGACSRDLWNRKFSWPVVALQYRSLWLQLSDLRSLAAPVCPPSSFASTARLFRSYPSLFVSFESLICSGPGLTLPALLYSPMQNTFMRSLCGDSLDSLVTHLESSSNINCDDLSRLGVEIIYHQSVMAALVKFGIAHPIPRLGE